MARNPSVHPGSDEENRRPKRLLEIAAGKLELARKEVQMGVAGAQERYERFREEYERLRLAS